MVDCRTAGIHFYLARFVGDKLLAFMRKSVVENHGFILLVCFLRWTLMVFICFFAFSILPDISPASVVTSSTGSAVNTVRIYTF